MIALVAAACGGPPAPPSTTGYARASADYAASALRALDGTAFETLGVQGLADAIESLCDGLGVGAMGVAAADTGIVATDPEVAIFLEVLRTGLDQVCEEKVVVDLTGIYQSTVETAVTQGGAAGAYDEVAAIRAAPAVCDALDLGEGVEPALLEAAATLFGIGAGTVGDLSLTPDQGLVVGAVLATATALVCPEHLEVVESFLGTP